MALSLPKQRALAILPKITGSASVICSSLIAYSVIRDKRNRSKVYHRLLLGMSIADLSSSFWLALSTWPIPKETGILWASGNTLSCNFQGFFTQFGVSSPIYNGSLSIFYLLVIRYGWKEDQLKRIEPFLHGVPILWGLGTGIAGLCLTLFNSANLWCWVAPYEDRGENADIYRWAFFYGPLWLMEVVVTVNLYFVWVYVRNVTKRSENHMLPNNSTNSGDILPADESANFGTRNPFVSTLRHSMSSCRRIDSSSQSQLAKRRKQVANQCFRYGGAFYLTWIPITLVRVFQTVNVEVMYGFLLLAAITTPFQGLPNFLVYLYPKWRRTKPELGFWRRFRKLLSAGESNKGVEDDLIEQERLESHHEEGGGPAAGSTISSSEGNIELVGDRGATTRKATETETN